MPPLPRVRVASGLFVAAALACSSCSSDGMNPVAGKVLVSGQPAVGAVVTFFPEGAAKLDDVVASGVAGADGTFTLSTGTKTGAPAGKYVVAVVWLDPKVKATEQQKMMGMTPDAPDLLKGRFSREKSTLRAEVKPGENKLDPFQIP
jgi:hypothetical protein